MLQFTAPIAQSVYTVPSFTLECGTVLREVPVAYKTWGTLNSTRDNVMIICHAFTGSADVEDWWGPLVGRGKAFDPNRFLIFCANALGSPYGSASPVTLNPDTNQPYGPEFPPTTIRDDVRIDKLVLDHLGVLSVAVAIGGSMGGMAVLEWPLCTPPGYVRHVIPLATSARHSAWCISWGEAQRQSIFADPTYNNGFYTAQPSSGLAAARMSALLTYRSRDSFESRFGRKPQLPTKQRQQQQHAIITPPKTPTETTTDASFALTPTPTPTPEATALAAHNDGHRTANLETSPLAAAAAAAAAATAANQLFSAQSYLRYQGDKFTARFDANCYIHITRKLDTHDVARGRTACTTTTTTTSTTEDESLALARVLSTLPRRALVISIESDALFTTSEQRELAAHIPAAELVVIPSQDGHDAFLLEFEQINKHILAFLRREFPQVYEEGGDEGPEEGFELKKASVFGEAEVDVARW